LIGRLFFLRQKRFALEFLADSHNHSPVALFLLTNIYLLNEVVQPLPGVNFGFKKK